MNTIMGFELRKFFNNRKNLIMIGLFFLLLLIQVRIFTRISNSFEDYHTGFIEENITLQQVELDTSKQALASDEIDDGQRQAIEDILLFRESALASYNNQLQAIQNGDAKEFWVNQQKINNLTLAYSTNQSPDLIASLAREDVRISALLEQGLKFEKDLKAPVRAWPFMDRLLEFISTTSIFLLVIILVGDAMSKDYDDHSIALYHSILPKRKNLAVYKGVVITLSSFFVFLVIIGLVFIGKGIFSGFGAPTYPLVVSQSSTEIVTVSMWWGTFLILFHYFFVLFFLVHIAILIGTIFKHSLITIGILIVSYYSFTILSTVEFINPFLPIIPFSQLDSYRVVSGFDSLTPAIPYWGSLLILLGSGLLCLWISRILLKNQKL